MTPEEIALITAIGEAIRSQPMAWDDIPEGMKETVIAIMRPTPSFTPEQRGFLNHWWLSVTTDDIAAINALMPENHVVSPRIDNDGGLWLSADLFTDAVDEGSRLNSILPLLLGHALYYHEEDFWPSQDEDESL
jgi:hypothetical protein